jgi:hypothetical protein
VPDFANAGPDTREFAETGAYIAEFGNEGRGDSKVVYPQDVSHLTGWTFKMSLLTLFVR